MPSELSIPEPILATLKAELTKIPSPYGVIYDSDDEGTCAILSRLPTSWIPCGLVAEMRLCGTAYLSGASTVDIGSIHGWIPEMTRLETFRRLENGG
jgi:hypothetical protein